MSRFLLILLLSSGLVVSASEPDLKMLRTLYYNVAEHKASADKLLAATEQAGGNVSAVVLGYRGVALMLKADNGINPIKKLNYFNKGKTILEDALKREKNNVELVFLRFCIQTNIPSFLCYSSNINDDKRILLAGWKSLTDEDLKVRIKKFLVKSSYCNESEKSGLL